MNSSSKLQENSCDYILIIESVDSMSRDGLDMYILYVIHYQNTKTLRAGNPERFLSFTFIISSKFPIKTKNIHRNNCTRLNQMFKHCKSSIFLSYLLFPWLTQDCLDYSLQFEYKSTPFYKAHVCCTFILSKCQVFFSDYFSAFSCQVHYRTPFLYKMRILGSVHATQCAALPMLHS